MIKTSTKKLTRTLSTIILFYALMLISYLLFWCSVFPEFIFFEKYYYLFVVNNTLFFASIITNLIVAYSDPGNLTQENTNDPKLDFLNLLQEFSPITLCEHCRIIKTPRTRHCPLCGKCSDRFDHHCPWINNCIGRGNIKRFYLFLTVQACYLVSALYSCIIYMSLEFFQEKKLIEGKIQENNLPHFEKTAGIAACLLAILFLASVSILLTV